LYDIFGLGNALVDTEYRVEDDFLDKHSIAKGQMTLVDEQRVQRVIDDLRELPAERTSGGSAANTVVAVQGFGGSGYFAGKLGDDETGRYFLEDMGDFGVGTNAGGNLAMGKSGQCLVLVTDDAERTMNTFLGVSSALHSAEIEWSALANSKLLYVEGYLSSSPDALAVASICRQFAQEQGVATAVTMSDPSIVTLFRDNLQHLLGNGVSHLFCNEEEALTWARTDRLDIAIAELKDIAPHCNVTLGRNGSMAVTKGRAVAVPGYAVTPQDTNGAGDIFAGACICGWLQGMELPLAAKLGNFAAATLVQYYGARLKRVDQYQQIIAAFRSSRPPPIFGGN